MQHAPATDLALPFGPHRGLELSQWVDMGHVRGDTPVGRPLHDLGEAGGRIDGSLTVAITIGQPSTSSPFIMIRLVGSRLALGAPPWPRPWATAGVEAQP
ncbi:MAG: hypothetical protein Q8M25_11555, partial [Rhodoferax sp.]|nr:hypothetical protein [Rhodoferax sp.]